MKRPWLAMLGLFCLGWLTGFAADTTPPSVPSGLAAGAVTISSFTLSWTASTDNVGVTGYEVFNGSVSQGVTAGISFALSGLAPNKAYSMRVRACDAAGNWSAKSAALSVRTLTDTTPPSVPDGLDSTALGLTSFTLNWNPSTDDVGVTSYQVYKNGTSVGTTTAASKIITGLAPNTAYVMTVRARDAVANWSVQSTGLTVTTLADVTAPTVPDGLAASSVDVASFTLNWAASTDDVKVTGYEIFKNGVSVGTTTALTKNLTGLTPATAYTMTVRAKDAASNWSVQSAPLSVITLPDVTPPSVPTGLAVSAVTVTKFTLTWPASTDNVKATAYEVFKDGVSLGTSIARTKNLTGLTPGATYVMTVRAGDTAGNWSDLSEAFPVTTLADVSPPTVPGSLSATAVTVSSFTLHWAASTDDVAVTGYEVYRNGVLQGSTAPGTRLLAVTGLAPATACAMTVRATDAVGNWSAQSAVFTVTTSADATAPSVPKNLAGSAVGAGSFTLTWTASTDNVGVTGYEVFQNGVSIGVTTSPTMPITGLTPHTAYSMKVRAGDAAGNWSAQSASKSVTTLNDTTAPSVPAGLAASTVTGTSFTLSWTASTDNVGVTAYEVFKNGTSLGTTAATSLNVTGLNLATTTYAMTVRARDAAGNWSAQSSALNMSGTADTTPPSVPTGLASSNVTATGFTVSWTAATDNIGVTLYEVFLNGVSRGTTTNTTMGITGLTPGQSYTVTIRAQDAAGNWSDVSTGLTVGYDGVPFIANFEPEEGYTIGPLAGQNGWNVTGSANIVTTPVFAGRQAVSVPPNTTASFATHGFMASDPAVTFIDFYALPAVAAMPDSGVFFETDSVEVSMTGSGPTGLIQGFDGHGTGGGTWTSSGTGPALDGTGQTATWVRFTVRSDYLAKKWDLYLGGQMILANLGFIDNTATSLGALTLGGHTTATTGFDELFVSYDNPLFVDANNNGIDDAWELAHGLSLADNNRDADPDGDGLTNLQEYIHGTDPHNADTDGDGISDGQEVALGLNPLVADTGFLPTKLPGLRLHLEANRGVTLTDAGTVSLWADQSGHGVNAYQGYVGAQPALVPNQLNGLPVVRFDGVGTNLSVPAFMTGATEGELFVIVKVPGFASRDDGLWTLGGADGTETEIIGTRVLTEDFGRSFRTSVGVPVVPLTDYVIYNVSATTGSWTVRLNGQTQYHVDDNTVVFGNGGALGLALGKYLQGDIAEVIAYDHQLTDTDRGSVFGYLTAKYAVGTAPAPPAISSALTASGTVGAAISPAYAITATNSPTSYDATGLPDGLSVDTTTGTISGTPTSASMTNVTISATNAGGTGSATLVFTINPAASDTEPPTAPTGLASSSLTTTGFTLIWTPSTDNVGVTGYTIYQDGVAIGTSVAPAFNISGLAASTSYSMTVTAQDAVGNFSSASAALSVSTLADPGNLPSNGMRLWLRADYGVTLSPTGTVSQWSDQSGHGINASQGSSDNQPALVPNQMNGLPVIRFDGVGDSLNVPAFMAGATEGELYVVFKLPNFASRDDGLWALGGADGTETEIIGTRVLTEDFGRSFRTSVGVPVVPLTDYVIYNVSATTGSWTVRLNGQTQYHVDDNTVVFGNGGALGTALGKFLQGDIAEVLAYDHMLTSADRVAVETSLNNRYAIVPLPDAPANLTATATTPESVNLAWAQSGTVPPDSYTLERKTGADGTYAVVNSTTATTSYVDAPVVSGQTYFYRIQAVSAFGSSAYSNEAMVSPPLDSDGDGVSDADEIANHTDPFDYYNGVAPVLTIVSGDGQVGSPGAYLASPLVVRAAKADGTPLINAPVIITVVSGTGGVAASPGATAATTVTLRTDAQGLVQAYWQTSSPSGDDVLQGRADTPSASPIYSVSDPVAPLNYTAIPMLPSDGSSGAILKPQKVTERGRVLLVDQSLDPEEDGYQDAQGVFHAYAPYSLPAAAGYRWVDGIMEPLHLQPSWQPAASVLYLYDDDFVYAQFHTAALIGLADMNDHGDAVGYVGTDYDNELYFHNPAFWPVHQADALQMNTGAATRTLHKEGIIPVNLEPPQQSYRDKSLLDVRTIADNGTILVQFTDDGLFVPGLYTPPQDQHQGTYTWSSSASAPVFSENSIAITASPDGSQIIKTLQDFVSYTWTIHGPSPPYPPVSTVQLYNYSAPTCTVNAATIPYAITGPINNHGRYLSGTGWAEPGVALQSLPGLSGSGAAALAINDQNDILGRKADGSYGLWTWHPLNNGVAAPLNGYYAELTKLYNLPAGWQLKDLGPTVNDSRMLVGRMQQTQDANGNAIPAAQQTVEPVLLVPAGVAADVNHIGVIRPDNVSGQPTSSSPVVLVANVASANSSSITADDLPSLVPVVLDIKGLLLTMPIESGYTYTLKQADGGVKFIYTSLNLANDINFRSGDLSMGFGPSLSQPLVGAMTQQVTAAGTPLTSVPFMNLIKAQGVGIILLESQQSLSSPLIVEVTGPNGVIKDIPVPLSSFQAELAVDANHDGQIELAGEAAPDVTSTNQPFHFWLNDGHSPGSTSSMDYLDASVDGTASLNNFFPVFLDLRQMIAARPPSASVKYYLKQADGAVSFVYTNLTRDVAYSYQAGNLTTGFGPTFTQPAATATVQQVTVDGIELSTQFLANIQSNNEGVILVEGRTPTMQPLMLVVQQNGETVVQVPLYLSLGPRILILLHGMNSDTKTWNDFVQTAFNNSSAVIDNGAIEPTPALSSNGVRCYKLQFGAYDNTPLARVGLEGWTVNSTDDISSDQQTPCGDYEDFATLGREIDDAITLLLQSPQNQNAQIVLLGHSRGGVAARAFLQGSSPNRSSVIGLLTTGSPQQGSPLARIYPWLNANPRHVFDNTGMELTIPIIIPPGGEVDLPVNWQDWSVVDWLRSPKAILNVFINKPPLDVRRPVIGELSDNSSDIVTLNSTSAVAQLPTTNITYGEIVYDEVSLGNLTLSYSVFDGKLSVVAVDPLTDEARAFILGTNDSGLANTVTTWRGDGLVPTSYQLFTTMPGFAGTRVNPLANVDGTVVHTDEPKQISDLLDQFKKVAPTWLP